MGIRNACKALIVSDGKFLLNHYLQEDGTEYYDLPGGGQEQYETLEEAVVRESREETGFQVEVVRLAAIEEEIYQDPQIRRRFPDYAHRVHFVFLARPVNPIRWEAKEPDVHQVGCRWITPAELEGLPTRPADLAVRIPEILASSGIVHFPPLFPETL